LSKKRGLILSVFKLVFLAGLIFFSGPFSGLVFGAVLGFCVPRRKSGSLYKKSLHIASRVAIGCVAGFLLRGILVSESFVDSLLYGLKVAGITILVSTVVVVALVSSNKLNLRFGSEARASVEPGELDPNRSFSKEQREWLRQYQNNRCFYCQEEFRDKETIHADHIDAHSKGGRTLMDNAVAACSTDNLLKTSLSLDRFAKKFHKKYGRPATFPSAEYLETQLKKWERYERRMQRRAA